MRQLVFSALTALLLSMNAISQTPQQLADGWKKHHITKLAPSDVRHADLKKYLDELKKLGVKVEQVGFSNASREIYQAEWGIGALKVFMWSQMHGDEPTATSAVVDMFAFLQKNRDKDWVKKIGSMVTIRAVPMLNPDGAETYVRRNLQGIDVNRDAIDLKTPEAQLLKRLRDDWNPAIGFNLHNQNALTTVGSTPRQAAISLLVVYGDEAKTTSFGHERNMRLASAMAGALRSFIPGHIGLYDDEWTPNAFGDNFSAWGTPTILIETGALEDKDEAYLVKMNFVAMLTALHSLATGAEAKQTTYEYLSTPPNSSGLLVNVLFRRANVVTIDESQATIITTADIGSVTSRRRASFTAPTTIRSVGDLPSLRGLTEYDASNFNVIHRYSSVKPGELTELLFYRKDRAVGWRMTDLERSNPPDAIFSTGKWIKGEKVVPKR